MIGSIAAIILWLFIINLGIAFGAGLYESRLMVPQWISFSQDSGYRWNAEAARRTDVGLKFWVYATTVPLTLLTLASFVVAWWTPDVVRNCWLGAAAAAVVERVMTGTYFIPTMIKLMRPEAFEESEATVKAVQWARLGYIRLAAVLVAWLCALMAFSLMGKNGGFSLMLNFRRGKGGA
jgi:hypothetical protein